MVKKTKKWPKDILNIFSKNEENLINCSEIWGYAQVFWPACFKKFYFKKGALTRVLGVKRAIAIKLRRLRRREVPEGPKQSFLNVLFSFSLKKLNFQRIILNTQLIVCIN